MLTGYVVSQPAPVMLDPPAGHLELMTARGAGEAAECIALEVLHGAMQAENFQQQPWPRLGSLHCAQLQGKGMCPQRQATAKAGGVCLALQRGMMTLATRPLAEAPISVAVMPARKSSMHLGRACDMHPAAQVMNQSPTAGHFRGMEA